MSAELNQNTKQFLKEIREAFGEEVRTDRMSRGLYSTDASIYMQMPLGVFTPRKRGEVRRALKLAHQFGVPVLPRAGGTSLAGQTTGLGSFVLDISKHMDELEELNAENQWAVVGPGMVRDRLNGKIVQHGLWFAPETSTSNRANIGGMMGNNSSGMMSIRYGITMRHILGAWGMLADGSEFYFGTRGEMDDRGRELLDGLMEIVNRNRAMIEEKFPKVIRRVGGYSLDQFLGDDPNLVKILCGAEGTLAFVTSVKVHLEKKPKSICAVVIHYKDLDESLRSVPLIVKHNVLSAEFMDGALIEMCTQNPTTSSMMGWLRGKPEAVIPVELDGETFEECEAKIDRLIDELKGAGFGYEYVKLMNDKERYDVIEVRKAGLGVMERMPGDWKPISFIEDACVPVENLAAYADGVLKICKDEDIRVMTYGHASVGVLHLKPVVNLKTQEDRDKCVRISRRCMELCRHYKGSWSGEHGDGIARGAYNELFWGDEMIEVFREVKRLFDPKGILNPGKIFDTPPVMGPLRFTNGYQHSTYHSMYKYRADGGFESAVEMCNGVGACRKLGSGTMCPSYMATRDEKDTTRGRANALRMAMSNQLGPDALTSDALYDVMDLCLECKACKSECPSNVDMAKMKSEFLHLYGETHGRTLRSRIFAFSPDAARLNAGFLAPFVNGMLSVPLIRRMVNRITGVATQRELPKYATVTLPKWFKAHREKHPAKPGSKEVVLFNDTYSNYHEPGIGVWAVRVLEKLGYNVELANAGCCCRPMMSKGYLKDAKERGGKTLRNLDRFVKEGKTIVTLEPSCCSSLKDDLPDLIDDEALGKRVGAAVMPIEEFLEKEFLAGRVTFDLPSAKKHYLLHGHCHQKALNGTGPLKRIMGSEGKEPRVREVDSGCCGMAGSFGYEKEHYDLSQQIGEQRLFPAVRALKGETQVIANGFSCRHQIKDATGAEPMHFIEALGRAMMKGGRAD
ncbi:FAD-binding protein [Candidatus Sumerlaeota bacterium]|nr:FAD-binding protein [Candidatus Sumerlaeota bacterium]